MDIFEGKNKRYCKRLTKHSFTNKASGRHVCCEVCKLNSRALSHEPSSDCVIARAKGSVRAQASYGNITVLSLLKRQIQLCIVSIRVCLWQVFLNNLKNLTCVDGEKQRA